jgi:ubiquinone/menaquinone biosynthesis C-methylase UbiE
MGGSANARDLKAAWSGYWGAGHTESCPGEGASLAPLAAVWRGFFSTFRDGARLLDIATGGGFVVRLALEAAEADGKSFAIDGIDMADLSKVRGALNSRRSVVRLASGVDAGALPFADASFDGVCSQFGVEYTDVSSACHEAVRVMRPAARGLFVIHHRDSAITSAAIARVAAYRAVFANGDAYGAGRKVFELYARRAPRVQILDAEGKFRRAVRDLEARVRTDTAYGTAGEIVAFLSDIAKSPQIFQPADALKRIAVAEREVSGWALRQQAQIESALDGAGIGQVSHWLSEAGAWPQPPAVIAHDGEVLAWQCAFEKRD